MTSRQPNTKAQSIFLFDSLGSKTPNSSRKVHIRRLVDVLQLSIHRSDWPRAQRAWRILVRCKEFDWKEMWKTGLLLAGSIDVADLNSTEGRPQRLEYLRVMMLRSPERRISILQEIILHLIVSSRHQDALDELELYLPSFPYQDDPVLHIYAGMLRLSLAQDSGNPPLDNPNSNEEGSTSPRLYSISQSSVRECKSHFKRALDIDPENPVALEFITRLMKSSPEDSDDDENGVENLSEIESWKGAEDKRPHKKRRPRD